MSFVHLHVHSHYSVLDGMSKVPDLIEKAGRLGMPGIALTDHGVMYGIKELLDVLAQKKRKLKGADQVLADESASEKDRKSAEKIRAEMGVFRDFKAVVGVEAYCAHESLSKKKDIEDRGGWHLVLLAKNKKGYQNLCKLVSASWVDGFYYRPRIDKELLKKHSEGLIVSSACLGGEIPKKITNDLLDEAEASILWFKEVFGDDYYLELQRHQSQVPGSNQEVYPMQIKVNKAIITLAKKTNTKYIATNDVHFVEEEHAQAHDRLICLSTGKDYDDPSRMHYSMQEWLKSPAEMKEIFSDVPEALSNTLEILDKVEEFSVDSGPLMPVFPIPEDFGTVATYKEKFSEQDLFDEFTQDVAGNVVETVEKAKKKVITLGGYDKLYRIKLEADYLSKMAWEGANFRYKELTDEIVERIEFELYIMKTMGFPGYFLIVQDLIQAARDMGVSVGPGRGSAAGSVVAYCLKITDVDPLPYNLLFERFLNPDRISLPDIDIDFDDDGRSKVLHWVTEKYGEERVANIVTYGTMKTKNALKDVARVLKVPLGEVNALTKMIPDAFSESTANKKTGKLPKINIANCIKYLPDMKAASRSSNLDMADTIKYAGMLEGTIRQTGVHACGVIIGADDLTNTVPLSKMKDKTGKEIRVTQYDGSVIETVGLIKMDFLGLKTLSVIKEAIANIKKTQGIDVDIDTIPIDDAATFKLYSNGFTVGTFQFESAGMQKYLKELKPSCFEDLIAMNALYRPGPIAYIPQFISRKHGREPIVYDLDVMEKYLKETYGITVYQEQVMLLSRLLAGFTRGESDSLRKAMGKKIFSKLAELKPKFLAGGKKNGHAEKTLEKIWHDWEEFAKYAFNKSHATCYSWISYQTAYLKANYTAEFMAANLTRNKDDIAEVTKFMEECKSLGIQVLTPDVNESHLNFIPNKEGDIRFGLGGVKGVGEGAVEAIVEEREANGRYKSVFDFVERIRLSACNKKAIESLALSGAFDDLGDVSREAFFITNKRNEPFIELLIRYANRFQSDTLKDGNSLFGDMMEIAIQRPEVPKATEWTSLERLNKEKSVIGIYLSSHPMDEYRVEIESSCNAEMSDLNDQDLLVEKFLSKPEIRIAGIVSTVVEAMTKKNRPYLRVTMEDYGGSHEFFLFGNQCEEFASYFKKDAFLMVYGKMQEKGADFKKFQQKKEADTKPKKYEFKVLRLALLADLKGAAVSGLKLRVPLLNIDRLFIDELSSFMCLPKEEGAVTLYIDVIDPETCISINSASTKKKIRLDSHLVDYLKDKQYIEVMGEDGELKRQLRFDYSFLQN